MDREKLAEAFTEWARRYKADPAGFSAEVGDYGYGDDCAGYLLDLLAELS